jgi:hypothetical protein
VATGFPHARELLADGVGDVVEHESGGAIAVAVRRVLESPDAMAARRRTARSADTPWAVVADRYRELAAGLATSVAARTA